MNGNPRRPSEIVEFTKTGAFVAESNVDAGQGGAFGPATRLGVGALFDFAADDDAPNVVIVNSLRP